MNGTSIPASHEVSPAPGEFQLPNPYKARFSVRKGYFRSYINIDGQWIQLIDLPTIQKIINVQELPVPLDIRGDIQRVEFFLLKYAKKDPAFFDDKPSSVQCDGPGAMRGTYSELTIPSSLEEDDEKEEGVVVQSTECGRELRGN